MDVLRVDLDLSDIVTPATIDSREPQYVYGLLGA